MALKLFKANERRKLTVSFFATVVLFVCLIISTLIFFRAFETTAIDERKLAEANQTEFLRETRIYEAIAPKGDNEKSLAAIRRVADVLDRTPTQEIGRRATHNLVQADLLMQMGKDAEANQYVASARKILADNNLVETTAYCDMLLNEGKLLARKHQFKEAIELYQQSLSCAESMSGLFSGKAGIALEYIGTAYLAPELNQPDKALEFFTIYEAILNSISDDRSLELMNCHKSMAMAYILAHKYTEAEEKLNLAKETALAKLPKDDVHYLHILQIATQLEQLKKTH